ncbi:UDP-2,3-diacylglucosamine diphosphatase [Shewanella sedimentimangrovi]|uniref:UDP-2,3-diacylglucosamine hydrolase n=1 Tax=Shewanella sedimentimangrovi TaxID=2814293 RepID=A0ABX7R3V8_9GAMM|nr:UDP-2,3-diacylglucosamine diphosphatase [Shewanella sedimentimangrovi]QSX38463.1 UDP-2,3-diacylglucosamine diphosphatase [Shewanella sedimentimangrovi]
MRTLFIGDLHLSAARPDITRAFLGFLEQDFSDVEALYILGDLFEVWVGDDLAEPFALNIAARLKRLSDTTPLYFIHGNRDFLLGKAFANASGMQLLDEVHVTELYGVRTVLLHGDSLCTLDKAYQRFRRFRNLSVAKWLYGLLPQSRRLKIAAAIRAKSQRSNSEKQDYIMDVEPGAVEVLLDATGAKQMIHGHTHRPAIHALGERKRIVVGDWYSQSSVLTLTAESASLSSLPLE